MINSTHALSATVIRDFCTLCDKAHEYWLHYVELFDKNQRNAELCASPAGEEWIRLSVISHEHSLLQIRKLHDKAGTSRKSPLGIDYMLKHGVWSDSVLLKELAEELDGFANKLKDVRNKILSHYDLRTIEAGAPLGDFPEGEDEKYFEALQKFVNIVHHEVIGGPWWFDNRPKDQVAEFLATIKSALPPTPHA